MQEFVQALRDAVAAEAWHSALALALALPDICARVETPAESSTKRYPRWWTENAEEPYRSSFLGITFLTGEDAYALRCAYLHEGQDDIQAQKARKALTRFAFTDPTYGNHSIKVGNVLQLSVDVFYLELASAVETWVEKRKAAGMRFEPTNILRIPKSVRIGNAQIGGEAGPFL